MPDKEPLDTQPEQEDENTESTGRKNGASSIGNDVSNSLTNNDLVGTADNLSGGKASKAIQGAVDNTNVGKAVNKARDTVDDIKNKAIDTATKPLKEAGKKVADQALKKGGELALKAGVGAAAGAATGGIATVASAAAEAAGKVKKISDNVRKKIKDATGGFIDPDLFGEAKDRLAKYWKENKWKIIGGSCIVFAILLILPFLLIVAAIAKFVSFDTTDIKNQKTVSEIESLYNSGVLSFSNSSDLDSIKKGEVGKNSIEMISYLAKRHKKIVIGYSSTQSSTKNEPYEFDVVSLDEIKCTNTNNINDKLSFPISLYANYGWSAHTLPSNPDHYLCAVSYYPKVEAKVITNYSISFGPGEFSLSEIKTAGPKATQEKTAELVEEVIRVNENLGINAKSDQNILPVSITINSSITRAAGNSGTNIAEYLAAVETKFYPNAKINPAEGIIESKTTNNGVHISFL